MFTVTNKAGTLATTGATDQLKVGTSSVTLTATLADTQTLGPVSLEVYPVCAHSPITTTDGFGTGVDLPFLVPVPPPGVGYYDNTIDVKFYAA